jgi:four helix bundle protein
VVVVVVVNAVAFEMRNQSRASADGDAEGSGKSDRDAARFYTIARASALECAAILDALEALRAVGSKDLESSRELLERVVSMLTKLRKC